MKRLLVLLFLAGCSGGGGGGSSPPQAGPPLPPTTWTLWFSPGTTLGTGPSFDFPTWNASCPGPTGFGQTCPSVQYLVNQSGVLTGRTLTMKVTVTGSSPIWNYANIQQDGNTGCATPPSVRFYFQQAGDNWSGAGAYAFYRWWSSQAIQLALGTFTLSVPLTPAAGWSSVEGGSAAANPGPFATALASANTVGMTFGGGCFYGHGVDLTGGSANFVVDSFTIQ